MIPIDSFLEISDEDERTEKFNLENRLMSKDMKENVYIKCKSAKKVIDFTENEEISSRNEKRMRKMKQKLKTRT